MNILKNMKIQEVLAPIALADDTDSNSDILDMANWDGVIFILPITDCLATGVVTITIEQNTANSDSGMAALSGATATATSVQNDDLNNTLLIVEVVKPRERYVQCVVTTATANVAVGNMVAIQYRGRKGPVTQPASVQASTLVASPAEA